MQSPPTGTLTLLFTDIEGSTRLWEHDALAMQAALTRHDEILKVGHRAARRIRLQDCGGCLLCRLSNSP